MPAATSHALYSLDAACLATNLGASFGVHPGGAYGSVLRGTWVAPAGGAWLLRIDANCDVPFCAHARWHPYLLPLSSLLWSLFRGSDPEAG